MRRSFTAAYRARVVAEYEAAPHGSKAAVLRREGLYQSQIREWTIARDALVRGAIVPRRAHRASGAGGKDDNFDYAAVDICAADSLCVVDLMDVMTPIAQGAATSSSGSIRRRR